MRLFDMISLRTLALSAIVLAGKTAALSQEYCSPENTGSDYDSVSSIYQSNGLCYQQCLDSYAFAILQGENCWCSNYAPGETESVSECDESCSGYPSDKCGNTDQGLFGYIALRDSPSGTVGASTSAAATTSASSTEEASSTPSTTSSSTSTEAAQTSYVSQTIYGTVTSDPSTSIVVSYVTPTFSSPSTMQTSTSSTSSTTSSTTSTTSMQPVTSVQVVTVSGAAVTQTVTTTPSEAAAASSSSTPVVTAHHKVSGGAIAGGVIGGLLALAAIVVAALFLWRRKRQQADAEAAGAAAGASPRRSPPRRNTSVLSRTGLLSTGARVNPLPDMAERDWDEANYGNVGTASNSARHSMLFGAGGSAAGGAGAEMGGVSPVSPLGSSTHDAYPDDSRRHSRPMVYDQRLNPSALFVHTEGNGSRVSMQDQQDYSRPLGVMNPDVRPSFESRDSYRQ